MGEPMKTVALKIRRRPLLFAASLLAALSASLVVAVHELPGAGPLVANSLRAVIGIDGVARLEEAAASVEDTVMRWRWQGAEARSLDALSPLITSANVPAARSEAVAAGGERNSGNGPVSFAPASVKPPFAEVAGKGDGVWVPVPDPEHPEAPAVMYETLIHPDPERRWSELFVVAMPTSQVRIASTPGVSEPSTTNPAAQSLPDRGLIPLAEQGSLLAAFNGGFRAEHGHHGMFVDGVMLLPPQADLCTVAGYADGSLRIGDYARLAAQAPQPAWFRQAAPCMVEDGVLHPGLRDSKARRWGSTLEGDTVIRRSAIALSQDGATLYVAVSNYTTASVLANGMRAVGGWNVSQLDVNYSFPKFLLFPRDRAGVRHAASLFKGFLFEPKEMLTEPASRDFFYVVRRHSERRA